MDRCSETETSALVKNIDSSSEKWRKEYPATAAETVLVGLDLSWGSRGALAWADRFAALTECQLEILHVLHDPAEAPGKYNGDGLDPIAPMIDRAEAMLVEFMAELLENHPELSSIATARTHVLPGLPAQTIVNKAIEIGASLIVVGSRGWQGLPRLIHGSTAQRVLEHSPIPVTVVKDGVR